MLALCMLPQSLTIHIFMCTSHVVFIMPCFLGDINSLWVAYTLLLPFFRVSWSFLILILFCYFLWVIWLHVYLCIICVFSTFRGQKMSLDPLELELQTVVSHHVSAGSWICVLWKKRTQPLSHLLSPRFYFIFTYLCMSVCGIHVHRCPTRTIGVRFCRIGSTGDCDPLDMDAGNQTLVLWKEQQSLLTTEPFLPLDCKTMI